MCYRCQRESMTGRCIFYGLALSIPIWFVILWIVVEVIS